MLVYQSAISIPSVSVSIDCFGDSFTVGRAGRVGNRKHRKLTDMAAKKWIENHFSEALKEERKRRDWSQGQLQKMLADKGVHLHSTTIAKIEKGERSVRIDEAAAIAELFDTSVDALLGRQPDDTTLTFAMMTLLDYIGDAEKEMVHARGTASDIEDQLEDAAERFNSVHIEALLCTAHDMARHLDKARMAARKLGHVASLAIVDEGKETK
jgi:transcriptional regulator with XRE-family HTH domain